MYLSLYWIEIRVTRPAAIELQNPVSIARRRDLYHRSNSVQPDDQIDQYFESQTVADLHPLRQITGPVSI
ncbi:hypothetical protein [Sphingomonas sp.]|uniref:hypothetical protein n=1 Tax=Sphingomonas sp. TaxID=28214 RepID=UPI002E13122F